MSVFQIVAIVVCLALTVVAAVLTTRAVQTILAVMRTGQPSLPRTANPVGRSVTMVKETFGHTRMLQWSVVGVMHWFVYLAFIVLGGAVFTAYFQLFSPEFQLPIIGHFVLYEWLGEALGVLGTIGIVYLAIYRQRHHPRSEGRNSRFYRSTMWQAYFVEAMALIEGALILFIRGAEYNLGQALHPAGSADADHYTRFHFPVSSFFGDVLYGTDPDTLETTIIAIGTIKIVLAMVWLIVIARNTTMGIAWHRFTAFFNIWLKREPSGRTALGAVKPLTSAGKAITLDNIDDLDEDALLGVGSIEDFSWKNVLDFTTCTECGRCQSQCPAWNTEKPLSPKLLITALRDATYAKAPYVAAVKAGGEEAGAALLEGNDTLTREVARPLVGDVPEGEWFYNPESGAAVIDAEVLWNCTSCGACVQQCPVDIEHVDHIIDMRRYAVLVESNFPSQLNGLFKGLEQKGNPWNMSPTARMDWAKGLDFEVRVVGADPEHGGIESLDDVEWLFWVGCAGAYEDRAKKTTRAVAELLTMAGVSFGVLGNGETCTGDPARRAGNEFVFQGLAQQNVEVFKEARVKKVVSTCAHCFNTLKNEYADFGIELEVVHHTQLLNRLVREGRLTPVNDGAGAHKRSITYHDPCYIGRHNGVYSPPRELLEILPGADFVEMERNSERSFCCGAGGARMWMEETIGSRINVNRTKEAVATGADQIAVGCPFCRVMLSDGLTAEQAAGEAREEVEILDVAQMLLASVKGEMATKLAPGSSVTPADAPAAGVPEQAEEQAETDDPTTSEPEAKVADDSSDKPGPVAKAAGGGSSLFDDPTPAETADVDASPAEEAQAATAASSGGSLFDLGDDGADAGPEAGVETDVASEPEPAGDSTTDDTASSAAAGSGELGSSGSLFDLGDAEPSASATERPAKVEPAAAAPAAGASRTSGSGELGSSGSLFDLGDDEPSASATEPAANAETAAEPAGGAPPEPAPQPAAAAAEPEAVAPVQAKTEPVAVRPTSRSLFDIAAPAGRRTAAPPDSQSAAEPAAPPAKEPAPESVVPSDAPGPTPAAQPSSPSATASAGSGSTSTPGTEIPETGSLFDIPAPEQSTAPIPTTRELAAGPAPAAEAEPADSEAEPAHEPEPAESVEPEATATVEESEAEPAPAEPEPEPAESVEPEAAADSDPGPELTPAQQLSAAATDAANRSAAAPDQPEATATVEESEAEPAPAEPEPDQSGPDQSGPEQPDPEPTEPEPDDSRPDESKPTSSGATNTPRTDVDISETGSLFDL